MARPSKLSPEQWDEIERRLPTEGASALGREFGISEAAIRKKFGSNQTVGANSSKVRGVAQKIADARDALAELPVRQQYVAVSLAERLRNISSSLASAAELGAATAHRLHALANSEVAKVDDAEPMDSIEKLRNVGVLTKLANESSHVALNLLAANKDAVKGLNDQPSQPKIDPGRMSSAALEELLAARINAD